MTLLELDSLCAGYGKRAVLHDLTARIGTGELVVLIGANASGKSTLVRVLAGLHATSGGGMAYANAAPGVRPPIGLAVAPDALPNGLSGFHALELVASALRTRALDAAIEYAHAVDLHPRLHAPIASYSLGTRQKLAITLAMVGDPRLLLLDESLNGLDLPSVGATLEFLRERTQARGLSALLVTHNIDLAQLYAQRVWLLEHGRLRREWTQDELANMQCNGQLISRQVLEHFGRTARDAEFPSGDVAPA